MLVEVKILEYGERVIELKLCADADNILGLSRNINVKRNGKCQINK